MSKKEDNGDLGKYHYRLTETENGTVTIEMPKRVFTTFMKITKFGNDCINFNALPTRIPGKTKGTASAINGLSYDAFKMGREMYEERIKNKLKTNDA